jgi:hypothetical protein
MIISHKSQTLDLKEDIAKLLCQIDKRLSKDAKTKLDALRFGADDCVDEDIFFILSNYRKILLMKACNKSCISQYSLDDIISNIKQYLTSGKIFKLNPSTSFEDISSVEVKPKVEMYVINNYYGDNITYYSTNNRYVTVEDSWYQIDW